MKTDKSDDLYRQALQVMPGGVSSPVRAFKAVGGHPLFIKKGAGDEIWDADGNKFIDYVLSWGPLILGHANPEVTERILKAIEDGTSFGAPTESEVRLAREICSAMPAIEVLRFVNSGTEATMSALRLARAATKKNKVLKFDGGYHGHADPFLSQSGSGLATLDIPISSGVPNSLVSDTLTIPFNDSPNAERVIDSNANDLAAVIVEPVAGNMGVVAPEPGFLEGLREQCTKNDVLLIFDEVITGFRVSRGGAQSLYSIKPDITCLGKIIGGGFPVGAYGASREIMRLVSPDGNVYQAGTLSGNPIAMSAGAVTLSLLDEAAYSDLEHLSAHLAQGFIAASEEAKIPITVNRVGSMLGLFFGESSVKSYEDVKTKTDASLYPIFHRSMLESGSYFAPSPFESIFLSVAHTIPHLQNTVEGAGKAFRKCREEKTK